MRPKPGNSEYKIDRNQQECFINLERTIYPKDDTNRAENRKREMVPVHERISKGDPDARFYKKKNGEKSKLGYQNAFATDIKEGIITRVITIAGCDNMADAVKPLIENAVVPELTLDGEFSIGELIATAQGNGVILNVPKRTPVDRGIYDKSKFIYDYLMDRYTCLRGNHLTMCSKSKEDGSTIYRGSTKTCKDCPVVDECTKSKGKVRTLRRDKYELEWERHEEYIQSNRYQFAKVIRGILAEGKFFEANILYGLKTARYIGKVLMTAQAKMTAVVINLSRFLKVMKRRQDEETLSNEKSQGFIAS